VRLHLHHASERSSGCEAAVVERGAPEPGHPQTEHRWPGAPEAVSGENSYRPGWAASSRYHLLGPSSVTAPLHRREGGGRCERGACSVSALGLTAVARQMAGRCPSIQPADLGVHGGVEKERFGRRTCRRHIEAVPLESAEADPTGEGRRGGGADASCRPLTPANASDPHRSTGWGLWRHDRLRPALHLQAASAGRSGAAAHHVL